MGVRGQARTWGPAAGVLAALALGPSSAAAELEDEVVRLERAWRGAGFEVRRPPPLFLEQSSTRLLGAGLGRASSTAACTTVAILGVRGADFSLTLPGDPLPNGRPAGRRAERSLAGLVTLTRCGAERHELAQAAIEMRSSRGALEVIVAEGAGPPPPAREALLERSVPLPRALVDPGRAKASEGLDTRLRWAEERARRDGATASERREVEPSDDGAGRTLVPLAAGCHRLELFAAQGPNDSVADVDADLRDATTNRVLARDRSDTPDAHLETCVGETTTALLRFSGAPGQAALALLDARWPLPKGLPEAAPTRAKAGMARALTTRRVPDPGGPPIATLLGSSGATYAHLELEPGGCYVAAVAVAQGEARSLGLSVRGPGFVAGDDALHGAEGASAAFCAPHPGRAQVTVEARGSGFGWMLALWRVASATPTGGLP